MSYLLEKITPEIVEKILGDANCDEHKKSHLVARGGYFNNQPGLDWVIDREQNSYLFRAPKYDPREPREDFFFYLDGRLYRIYLNLFSDTNGTAKNIVYFEDFILSKKLVDKITNTLRKAFSVYSIGGLAESPTSNFSFCLKEI